MRQVIQAMGDKNDPHYNSSGCLDPTAYMAIRHLDQEMAAIDGRVSLVIKTVKNIIHLAGFELIGRIELRDQKTGRYFR